MHKNGIKPNGYEENKIRMKIIHTGSNYTYDIKKNLKSLSFQRAPVRMINVLRN